MSRVVLTDTTIFDRYHNPILVNDFCTVSFNRVNCLFCYKGFVERTILPIKGFLLWPQWENDNRILQISRCTIANDPHRIIKCENPLTVLMYYENTLGAIEIIKNKNYYKENARATS